MKKNGFTLAEVLITLAIIGVVATMTLPALMTNTAEQQAKTGLKKGINTLTEAAQMNQAIDGFDYASLTSSDTSGVDEPSLYGLLSKRASVDYSKSGDGVLATIQGTAPGSSENFAIFFRDGSAILFDPQQTVAGQTSGAQANTEIQEDNLVYGTCIIYDTNGTKGPNILSNCQGAAIGAASDPQQDGTSLEEQCSTSNRVIKDQFGVRLRGGYAVPNGAAARWAFEN